MAETIRQTAWVRATLARLADGIDEAQPGDDPLALAGIRTRGSVVAHRIAALLQARGRAVEVGCLDVTLYRDDLQGGGGRKAIGASDLPFDITDRRVFLVDDVLATGRTVRAAITELMDFGRPSCIRLAVLVDRGGRELPICPDICGDAIAVDPAQRLRVHLSEEDGVDEVLID